MHSALMDAMSRARIMEDTRYIAEETAWRIAGSDMERKAANYIAEQLREAGASVELHEIDAYISFPHSASIEVLSPEARTIKAQAFAQAASTLPEGVEAEIVHVGPGGLDDYRGLDVEGRITLSELSYAPPRPEKVRIAQAKGSVGQVMMNWGLPEHGTIPMGTCKPVWGNPTPENVASMPKIPAVGISLADGLWLAEQAKKGPVRIRIHCNTENRWGKIIIPVARIEGAVEPEKFVLIAGHYDAWATGATDNATGNAQMIETARILAANKDRLRRSIVFAFWSGHETGIMEGSSWFVDHFWDELAENCVCTFNVDSTGMIGTSMHQARSAPELADFLAEMYKTVLDADVNVIDLHRTGDQSFFGAGIPSLTQRTQHAPELQKEWRGATLGWWYHSELDTMDKVDVELLMQTARLTLATVWDMATRPALPLQHSRLAAKIEKRITELKGADIGIDFTGLAELAGKLAERTRMLEAKRDVIVAQGDQAGVTTINALMMRLSRILTPITSTVAGRWTQDTYGLSSLSTILPGLFETSDLLEAGPDSDSYKLQWTETLRQRNRARDGLTTAIREIDAYLDA